MSGTNLFHKFDELIGFGREESASAMCAKTKIVVKLVGPGQALEGSEEHGTQNMTGILYTMQGLDLNYPRTFVDGIFVTPELRLLCRLDLNHPPTAVGGIL